MDTADFSKTWSELAAERTRLIGIRTDLETEVSEIRNKIAHLNEVLSHLDPLTDNHHTSEEIAGLGLTDAIRTVFKFSSDKWSAKEIEQHLQERGYDFSDLSAPMASIYKILSRLEASGEIAREKEEGKVFFKWVWPAISDDDIPF